MSFKLTPIAPPRGVQFDQYVVTLKNGTAGTVTKGEVVVLDFANAAATDNDTDAGLTSGFVNFADISATEANNSAGIYGILLEDITSGNLGKVCLSGVVDAVLDGDTVNVTKGMGLTMDLISNVGCLIASSADADNALVGLSMVAKTDAGAAGSLFPVLFNGFAINRA